MSSDSLLPHASLPFPSVDGLAKLLDDLQGNGPRIEAAAGLARFQQERLQAIRRGARVRVKECLRGLQNLSRLMTLALEHPDFHERRAELAASAEHLASLAIDLESWQELADNAEFYGERREVAAKIAELWSRSAQMLGEWPATPQQD